jgi:hypothetical protein
MAEFRFYIRVPYCCPKCLQELAWKSRADSADSLMLVHEHVDGCTNSGKKFYAPAQQLTEICEARDALDTYLRIRERTNFGPAAVDALRAALKKAPRQR